MIKRCDWVGNSNDELKYHDKEWGVPIRNDQKLFEFLILEGAQAGLNWTTILKKRGGYVEAYDGFNVDKVAKYNKKKVHHLLNNPGIIRNRLKIESSIKNARAFIKVQQEFGNFSSYIWTFVNRQPKLNQWNTIDQIPVQTQESVSMSLDLKKRGFSFVGPTICYAYMQAVGMVNDHTTDCFRHHEICSLSKKI